MRFDTHNIAMMGGDITHDAIGMSLYLTKYNKDNPNECNWFQEMMDNIRKKNSQLTISQKNFNPHQTPIA